jgi:membrane fusion protein
MSLFREQALASRQTKWLGEIVLVRPISFAYLTLFAAMLATMICTFLVWGSYTKHSTVSGQLIPDSGLIKVYAPQTGIIIEQHVKEGQLVNAGEVLYVLSSERHSSTLGATQAAISRQVEQRQVSLRDEMQKTHLLQQEERNGLNNKIAGLGNELSKLGNQIMGQQDRVRLAEETLRRYHGLLQQDYISKEQFQQKQEDLLEQKNRLQSLERDRISIGRELSAKQTERSGLSLKHHNQLAQIDRTLTSTGQELSESEAKRRIIVTAPEAGTATAVIADAGQAVDGNRSLVSIVPAGATLRAELYAPSRAIGFVRPGDQVLIRYQAYPYQKFGHQKGVVESIAKTALPNNELNTIGTSAGSSNSEPMYRINVRLKAQQVTAYGKPQSLQAGMLLDADIQQEKLRLYEWVLEPLYSLTGKL